MSVNCILLCVSWALPSGIHSKSLMLKTKSIIPDKVLRLTEIHGSYSNSFIAIVGVSSLGPDSRNLTYDMS